MEQDLLSVIAATLVSVLPQLQINQPLEPVSSSPQLSQDDVQHICEQQDYIRTSKVEEMLAERDAVWEKRIGTIRSEFQKEMESELVKVHTLFSTVLQRIGGSGTHSAILSRDPRSNLPNDEQLKEKINIIVEPKMERIFGTLDQIEGRFNLLRGQTVPAMQEKLGQLTDQLTAAAAQIHSLDKAVRSHALELRLKGQQIKALEEFAEQAKEADMNERLKVIELTAGTRQEDAKREQLKVSDRAL